MLEDCAQITPATTWLEACGMLEIDSRFNAVESIRDREEIFAEHKHKLTLQARNLERQQRNEAMAKLREKMKTQDWLSVDATWRQAQDELAEVADFKQLDKIDALRVFEDLMHGMHREEEHSLARKRVLRRRAERKARNDFRSLLAEAKQAGTITAGSSWASCKPILQQDSRFLANNGRDGSTACELFDDVREVRATCKTQGPCMYGTETCSLTWRIAVAVQELEVAQEATLEKATSALREAGVSVGESTEVEAVAAVLTPEAGWEIEEVVTVHAALVAASSREGKEAARESEKKAERFLALLKDYAKDKEITVADSWGESMVALLEGHSAYKAMDSDEHRARLFGEFLAKLERKKSSKKKSSKKSKKRKGSSRKEKRKRDDDSDEEEGEVSSDSGDEGGEGGSKRRKRDSASPDSGGAVGASLPEDAAVLEARRMEILAQLKDATGELVGATAADSAV